MGRTIIVLKSFVVASFLMLQGNCFAQSDTLFISSDSKQSQPKLNQLSFSMDLLTHGEACAGGLPKDLDKKSNGEKSRYLLSRTRLIVNYQRPGLEANVVVQNSAVWGMSNNKELGLYEGWVKMTAKNGLFAQVGRVELAYDDERIIGPNDFAMAALSHDVLRLGYEGHGHKLHAIFAYNQNSDRVYHDTYYIDGAQDYKSMQTVWYHYDIPKVPLGLSLLFMNYGFQAGQNDPDKWDYESNPVRTVQQQMFGGYINYHPKYLTLEASYYQQRGKNIVNKIYAADIRAWMASAKATIKPSDKYSVALGYDYLSGDDYVPVTYGGRVGLPRHSVDKGFCPLFGSRTEFYGIMDYFYKSAYSNDFTPGLQNAYIGVTGKPISKLECSATYHYLATATALHNLSRTLGHSIEVQANYEFSKYISLSAGYTYMTGTETMDKLKQGNNSKNARWGWFSLVINPSLFTTKW